MNIVAFVPARGQSKSILRKNIKLLGDKPLIAYSIEKAFQADIQRVIVDTEDSEIAQIAKEYGAEVMDRPNSLAKDTTSMFEVLQAEIPRIRPEPDIVLLLQPTSPFRSKVHIKLALSMLSSNLDKYDSVVSVERVPEKYNPAVVIIGTPMGKKMVMGKLGFVQNLKAMFTGKTWSEPSLSGVPISQRITRRQDHPEAWVPTGSIYLFKTENLKKGSIYGDRVMLIEAESSVNINSIEDWEQAEEYLKNAK